MAGGLFLEWHPAVLVTRQHHRHSARSAFTLLELVMVLSVIVVMAAMVWPSVQRFFGEQDIAEQAHIARIELTRTRVKAIDTGVVYQFRYEPGGKTFIAVPLQPPPQPESTNSPTASTTQTMVYPTYLGELNERCNFGHPNARSSTTGIDAPIPTERLSQEVLSLVPGAAGLSQVAFSPPIRFFPDGTADDIVVPVMDDQGRQIDIYIRGFTGTVSAGEIRQEVQR